jgi:type IV secretion system protein VirD4
MKKGILIPFAVLSAVLFILGNGYGTILSGMRGDLFQNLGKAADLYSAGMPASLFSLSLSPSALVAGVVGFVGAWCIWAYMFAVPRPEMPGSEHGTSRFGTISEGKRFADAKDKDNNILFSKNVGIAVNRKGHNMIYERNNNVLVIGGSGSGKTRYYVKPNLLQMNTSYFVTDPKGTLLKECGQAFVDSGYKLRCFNTINFEESDKYNPLKYVRSDADILSFVNCLIKNTNGDGKGSDDPFWENSERLFYTANIALLRDWFGPADYNLSGLIKLLSMAEARDDDENFESALDLLYKQLRTGYKSCPMKDGGGGDSTEVAVVRAFDPPPQPQSRIASVLRNRKTNITPYESLAVKNGIRWEEGCGVDKDTGRCVDAAGNDLFYNGMPFSRNDLGVFTDLSGRPLPFEGEAFASDEDFALKNYSDFKTAAGKTLKSIIISCNVRVAPLAIAEVRTLLEDDEMGIDTLGDPDQKTIVFAILSDTDRTFSFLTAILMWQTVDMLCRVALDKYDGRLPTAVNFILDEFANIGTMPDIEKTIAVTRSRNIGLSIIIQSVAQLEARYEKQANVIKDCCDTRLFLGSSSLDTCKEISEMLGKRTIHNTTYGQSKGQQPSYSENRQTMQRDLLDPSEVMRLDRRKAIVMIVGTNAIIDLKYPLGKHPRYCLIDPPHKGCRYTKQFDYGKYKAAARRRAPIPTSKPPRHRRAT